MNLRGALKLVAGVLLATALVLGSAHPATAGSGSERIRSYDIDIIIDSSGVLQVNEVIEYDFSTNERRGIFREIDNRFRFDDSQNRVYLLDDFSVTASPGAPANLQVTSNGSAQVIRIGDPDITITGVHTYEIGYTIEGTLNPFEDHDELFWNVVGDRWEIPIDNVTVTVSAPSRTTRIACFAGPTGSNLPCDSQELVSDTSAQFTQASLGSFQGFTVVVGLPKGQIQPEPMPILENQTGLSITNIDNAFDRSPVTLGGVAAILAGGFGLIGFLGWKRGRDEVFAGGPVDAVFGSTDPNAVPGKVPLFDRTITPVEFEPPDDMRPGQAGTLIDEVAHPLDVTATIVDLAVRGFMRIEEIEKQWWFGKTDWRLVRLRDDTHGLHGYEALLFDGLFKDADGANSVLLSDLKYEFHAHLDKVQRALYDDVVEQGWFRRRPDRVRGMWRGLGILVTILGAVATYFLASKTSGGLVGIALVVVGIALIASAGKMPHRTAKGTAALRRLHGFRIFIEESEKERARFAEQAHLFTEYLPYAVVFGATEKWAKTFADLGIEPDTSSWYVGSRPFSYAYLAGSLNDFSSTTGSAMAATPGSSGSSGFSGGGSSGGGGGGGGGGSW